MGMHLHWYLTSACNMQCSFCFKPEFSGKSHLSELTDMLVQGDVNRVTITGGEPTLVPEFENILTRLRRAGIYISLHTNGLLLDRNMIDRLKRIVGDIAVPLDSMNREVQARLRGVDYLPVAKRVIRDLQNSGVNLGIHTVFSAFNSGAIPAISRFLDGKFDYWRVYEFNPDFVPWFGSNQEESIRRFRDIEELSGSGSSEKAGIGSLFGKFLLEDEKMRKHRNKRIQFVSTADLREPYIFLAPDGAVLYTPWFSGERKVIGNLLEEGFGKIKKTIREVKRDLPGNFSSEFFSKFNILPLFARLWEGNYFSEEVEEIDRKYLGRVEYLANLYRVRVRKLDAV